MWSMYEAAASARDGAFSSSPFGGGGQFRLLVPRGRSMTDPESHSPLLASPYDRRHVQWRWSRSSPPSTVRRRLRGERKRIGLRGSAPRTRQTFHRLFSPLLLLVTDDYLVWILPPRPHWSHWYVRWRWKSRDIFSLHRRRHSSRRNAL
jgi:hypothetical protein